MRVAFITDYFNKSHFGREPLGVLHLVAALKQSGADVDLFEVSQLNREFGDLKKFKPGIIAYSVKTGYHRKFTELNFELKKSLGFISLFGGPHATFYPELINKPGVDIVCRGEADTAIVELSRNIKGDYSQTENCWVKKDGIIHKNNLGRLIEDLDALPFPDRAVFEKYPLFRKFRMRNFLAGRGCLYECTYCYNSAFRKLCSGKGRYVRSRSVINLVREIEAEAGKNKLNFINFEDDIFVQDRNWLAEFARVYPSAIKLPFHCHVKADMIDEESIILLKEAGCFSVSMGVETASEAIRSKILNRRMTNELIVKVCSLFKKNGINIALQNMLGIPETCLEDDINTLRLNIRSGADYAITSLCTPYPGTTMAQDYPFSRDWDELGDYYDRSFYQVKDRRQRENLQRVFSVIVSFPFLLHLVPVIIKLPLSKFYKFLGFFWKYARGRKKIFPTGLGVRYNFIYLKRHIWR